MEKNIQDIHNHDYNRINKSKTRKIKLPTKKDFEPIKDWSDGIQKVVDFIYKDGFEEEKDKEEFFKYLQKRSLIKNKDGRSTKGWCYGIRKGEPLENNEKLKLYEEANNNEINPIDEDIIIGNVKKISDSDWYIGFRNVDAINRLKVIYDIVNELETYTHKKYKKEHFIFEYEEGPEENETDNKGGSNMKNKNNETPIEEKIKNLIEKGKMHQIILTGAPGTGKTHMAKKIAGELGKVIPYEFVQFHPSYDYTDFVEGIRPCESKNNSDNIGFKKVDGIFKAFCRKVVEKEIEKNKNNTENEEDKKDLYFFIIDEINRADLSKVFGELMFGLEKDKRGEKIKTQYSNLKTYDIENECYLQNDVFKDGFYIPHNVVVIGTMNDIDRSVESMDFALRRRFTWIDVEVDEDLLKDAFLGDNCIQIPLDKEEDKKTLIKCIANLNKYIKEDGQKYSLDKNYCISQGQFSNISEDFKDNKLHELGIGKEYISKDVQYILQWVWEYRLESLIKEYIRGYYDEKFINGCESALYEKNIKDIKSKNSENKQNVENMKNEDSGKQ